MRHVRLFPRALRKTQPKGSTFEYKDIDHGSASKECLISASLLEALFSFRSPVIDFFFVWSLNKMLYIYSTLGCLGKQEVVI